MKLILTIAAIVATTTFARAADAKVDFVKDVAPIIQANCVKCHCAEKHKEDLRFDNKADALKGSKHGKVIIPGDSKKSDVVRRISLPRSDDDAMPPKGDLLTKEQVKIIADWIDQGAEWPDAYTIKVPAK